MMHNSKQWEGRNHANPFHLSTSADICAINSSGAKAVPEKSRRKPHPSLPQ